MEPVEPAVTFRALEALEKLEHIQDEKVFSDHECQELPDHDQEMLPSHSHEEVSSDLEFGAGPERHISSHTEVRIPPTTRKGQKKKNYRTKRAAIRRAVQESKGTVLKGISLKKRSHSAAQGVPSPFSYVEDFLPSSTAWKGLPDREKDEKEYTVEELVNEHGMRVIPWDGR